MIFRSDPSPVLPASRPAALPARDLAAPRALATATLALG